MICPFLGRKNAVDNVQKSRLAGTVGTDDPNKFPLIHLKRNVFQHPTLVVSEPDLFQFDHGH